jgi:uncharacterized membrane protein
MLAKYNEVFPGCAERIVAMAESQANHRQALERTALGGNIASERRGQTFGFIVAMTAIVGGVVLIALGKSATGMVAILGALGALVGTFIYGRYKQSKERDKNRQEANKAASGS